MLVHVPEEVTFRRSENLRETLLLLVPKQLDGNIKEKGQLFESHPDLVLGNLLYCLSRRLGPDDHQQSLPTSITVVL